MNKRTNRKKQTSEFGSNGLHKEIPGKWSFFKAVNDCVNNISRRALRIKANWSFAKAKHNWHKLPEDSIASKDIVFLFLISTDCSLCLARVA